MAGAYLGPNWIYLTELFSKNKILEANNFHKKLLKMFGWVLNMLMHEKNDGIFCLRNKETKNV